MLCSSIRYSRRFASSYDMLKPRLVATELLKKRTQERSRKPSAPLNSADITILGHDSLGFRPSVLVSSEGNVYMFNCGSGTQRFCFTNKIKNKFTKLEHVFITNRTWDNISGLFGLALTIQDMGCPSLNVHSTNGIQGLFESMRNFAHFYTGMVCSTLEAKEYTDYGISIVPIALDYCARKDAITGGERFDTDGNKRPKFSSEFVSYLCTLPDIDGALDPLKCKELKVPVGPLLGKLKSGLDVTLADGRTVKSEDVCSPKSRGDKFLIIECPETDHVEPLISNIQLEKARNLRLHTDGQQIDFVIHLSPSKTIQSSDYQRWMQGFSETCKHFFLDNIDPKVVNFIECYRFQYLLHQIDDKIFPLLYLPENLKQGSDEKIKCSKTSVEDIDDEESDSLVGELEKLDTVTKLYSLDKISMRPKRILETLDAASNMDVLHRGAQLNPHYQKELDKLRKLQSPLPEAKDYEPELVFLGTGSAKPDKFRNTACILMNFKYPRKVSVIMDCGEDSHNQLLRHFGPDKTAEILKQLDLIYISHHHADHHIGMIDILRQRKKLTDRCVTLILPPSLENFINFHDQHFEDLRSTYKVYRSKHIRSKPSMGPDPPSTVSIKQTIYDDLEGLVDRLDVVEVDHCANSFAVVLRFNINHPEMKKFSVAYSGDARPSENFAIIGRGCDLLIHEATFDDRSMSDALSKKHCTTSEAIQMGRSMNAKFTILTHFSQRNSRVPYFTENFDEKVGFAFDNLSLRCPSYFCRLPIMKPMLSLVFKKSLADIDLNYLRLELRSKQLERALKYM